MKTGAIIKYLPKETTKDEIKRIRQEFSSEDHKLILMISGQENITENLCEFIKSRKIWILTVISPICYNVVIQNLQCYI